MQLLSPRQVKEKLPLSSQHSRFIQKSRQQVQAILTGKEPCLALVFGPCSIHDLSSAMEYARRLRHLAQDVQKHCFCVMRVYLEKPRTVTGWKGLAYDPHLDGSNDIQTGIFWARELYLTLTELEVPIAAEFLNPLLLPYIEDLVSWGFIGARTSASQLHREIASYLPFPIGFKNSTDGNVDQAIHAMIAARTPHKFLHVNEEGNIEMVESEGNPYTHCVLRGSFDTTNYDETSIAQTVQKLQKAGLKSRLLIDCSHGNCQKQYERQCDVFAAVLHQMRENASPLMGMMFESHLEEGNQFLSESPSELKYGVSITDPCIGWSDTEALVRSAALSSSVMRFTQS